MDGAERRDTMNTTFKIHAAKVICPWDTNKVGAFMYDVLPAELKGDSWGRYFSSGNA